MNPLAGIILLVLLACPAASTLISAVHKQTDRAFMTVPTNKITKLWVGAVGLFYLTALIAVIIWVFLPVIHRFMTDDFEIAISVIVFGNLLLMLSISMFFWYKRMPKPSDQGIQGKSDYWDKQADFIAHQGCAMSIIAALICTFLIFIEVMFVTFVLKLN